MKWPGMIEPGSSSDELILMMDFYPTLAEIGQATINQKIDGISLLPVLTGKGTSMPDRNIYWMRREGWTYGGQIYYAARHHQFKLVQNTPFENYQLFDLENDPSEKDPLPESHEMFEILKTRLREHIQQAGAVPWQKGK
jgi:arylsulfatase A-like enzyme